VNTLRQSLNCSICSVRLFIYLSLTELTLAQVEYIVMSGDLNRQSLRTRSHTHTPTHPPVRSHAAYRRVNESYGVMIRISPGTYANYGYYRKCPVNSDYLQTLGGFSGPRFHLSKDANKQKTDGRSMHLHNKHYQTDQEARFQSVTWYLNGVRVHDGRTTDPTLVSSSGRALLSLGDRTNFTAGKWCAASVKWLHWAP
jgi:hypothetical protein